jgi:signal peptidase I
VSQVAAESEGAPKTPHKSLVREYFDTIVVFVMILVFARSFVFMQSKIPSGSMLETLQIGDFILVNRFVYGATEDDPPLIGQKPISRGDVIVFRFPDDPDTDYVKRVVGLPDDVVEVRRGIVYVDGERLEEPYAEYKDGGRNAVDFRWRDSGLIGRRWEVPDDHYFVMGDNRDQSNDSRAWGFVPRALVKGKAFLVWYSYEEQPGSHERTGLQAIVQTVKKILLFPFKTNYSRLFDKIE